MKTSGKTAMGKVAGDQKAGYKQAKANLAGKPKGGGKQDWGHKAVSQCATKPNTKSY